MEDKHVLLLQYFSLSKSFFWMYPGQKDNGLTVVMYGREFTDCGVKQRKEMQEIVVEKAVFLSRMFSCVWWCSFGLWFFFLFF